MAETRRKFDRDFREGAVRLVRETGKPIAEVARDLGVSAGRLGTAQGAADGVPVAGTGYLAGRRMAGLASAPVVRAWFGWPLEWVVPRTGACPNGSGPRSHLARATRTDPGW